MQGICAKLFLGTERARLQEDVFKMANLVDQVKLHSPVFHVFSHFQRPAKGMVRGGVFSWSHLQPQPLDDTKSHTGPLISKILCDRASARLVVSIH